METLENRDLLAGYIISDEGWMTVEEGIIHPPQDIFYLTEQDDTVFNLSASPIEIHGLGGNDYIYGYNGAESTIYGGDGNDTIIGSNKNDYLVGGAGLDSISAGLGNDRLIGQGNIYQDVKSVEVDTLVGGGGFDLVGDTVEVVLPSYTVGVSNLTEWNAALTVANKNTVINITADLPQLFGNLKGATVLGNGYEVGGFFLTGGGVIDNVIIDLTTQQEQRLGDWAYNIFRDGDFYLSNVEIYGAQENFNSIYFTNSDSIIYDSYIHNGAGDLISAGGVGHLTIIDTVGHTAGPNGNNQVVTTHFGFGVDIIRGHYYDANTNVVAPDSNSVINLYYVTIEKGLRQGGLQFVLPNEIYGCVITSTQISVRGTIENCTIYGNGTVLQAYANSHVINNYVCGTRGVNLRENYVELIDNVFECAEDWFIFAGTTGHIISGNISL